MISYTQLTNLFESANYEFIKKNHLLFQVKVSERTLCGALMLELYNLIRNNQMYYGYFVDVEYNRNRGSIKTIKKTINGMNDVPITINCDLILHSRGTHIEQDNLIAIEMKKSSSSFTSKKNDKERLMALTKDTFDNVWSYDGSALPEHVCRYTLGVYYEINFNLNDILIEYYSHGTIIKKYHIKIHN